MSMIRSTSEVEPDAGQEVAATSAPAEGVEIRRYFAEAWQEGVSAYRARPRRDTRWVV
jgi:hypothetical protein